MVYCSLEWIRKRNANYLAVAIVTWASGMYVFMEMAPALFILPVLWLFYRPPMKLKVLLLAGILSLIIWYPYLQLESTRSFVDLRSQLLREIIWLENYKDSWCDPGLILRHPTVEVIPGTQNLQSNQAINVANNIWTDLVAYLSVLWGKANFVLVAPFSNFQLAADIPGISIVLTLLVFTSLVVLSVPLTTAPTDRLDRKYSLHRWFIGFAVAMFLFGLLFNELIVARYLSLDGKLEAHTISRIRWVETILVLSAIALLIFKNRIPAALERLINRLSIPPGTEQQMLLPQDSARLIVIAIGVPWLVLLLLAEADASRLERFWWLWPLQIITLAASVTYIPYQWNAPRWVIWAGTVFLLVVILGNPLLLSRLRGWATSGWAGSDADEVRAVNYVASRLEDKKQATIGYEYFIWSFVATYNIVDSRYKVGAITDLLFNQLHGVSNGNRCAEGISPDDEFRIVATSRGTNPPGWWYFDTPRDGRFHLLRQFGSYQVFKRTEVFRD
jgi:hypothetical protein